MPTLYNCKHDGDQFRISKFDSDWNVESSYLLDATNCQCPAGHRPSCRHRDMLPKFIARNAVGTQWFFDHDRGGWVQGWKEEPSLDESVKAQVVEMKLYHELDHTHDDKQIAAYRQAVGLGQPSDLEANLSASNEELIAQAQPLDLRQPSPSPTIRRRV